MSTESRRDADRRYNRSPKGRARHDRYNHSWKGQARWLEYYRRKAGWYEPGGMATDEEMRAFFAGFKF